MTEQPIEVALSQLAVLGLLIIVALVFALGHIAERDWRDRINWWKDRNQQDRRR